MSGTEVHPLPKTLLVVKPSSLGDIVHALQVLQSVSRQLPDCKITWIARDRFAPLVESAPFIHEVIHYRRKLGWRGIREIVKILRTRQFDMVWDMQGLLRSGLMTAAAGSPQKWGRSDSREGAGMFYGRQVPLPATPAPHHAVTILQEFPTALGLSSDIEFPLNLSEVGSYDWSSFFSGDPRKTFVIFTDSRGAEKEWKGFHELTRLIFETIPGGRIAWCAGAPESPDFDVPEDRFLNLTGCPFDEMLALARQKSVFIGNDSGPMHLSSAVGNLVLAIFGPTSPQRFGPWPIDSPVHESVTAAGGNLANLSPEAVMHSLRSLLDR
ncbi:glycosyltransferase family 9 protein [Luteolibacter pohnpeiensis]|uniref:Glycosyltransferase family 9 protein n=1 Tax=Luteolibacter pohnpeiensis TaxID=454153 RepID=A0A934S607_9BACT|nr:glycosyltransferase family 9 protein [Luteolibacter pohnpeiensis]MBK1882508.1 glycosyltransferase family 9 protein [Luteolibacter pohnpeiensis]